MEWDQSCYKVVRLENGEEFKVATLKGFECIVKIILNLTVQFAGIAAFIMLLVGGFKYLTSGGDPKKIEEAKKTLTYAVIGLALLLGGWFILLLIKEFTGIDVTQFVIHEE